VGGVGAEPPDHAAEQMSRKYRLFLIVISGVLVFFSMLSTAIGFMVHAPWRAIGWSAIMTAGWAVCAGLAIWINIEQMKRAPVQEGPEKLAGPGRTFHRSQHPGRFQNKP
jgi:hypothetical protein